jgi:UDP-N-acetylglucosamine acyltransferase
MIGGRPGKHYRLNLIGLRRSGFDADRIRVLSSAFRRLRNREDLEGLEETPELLYLREWLTAESKRHGILGFIRAGERSSD